MEEDQKPKRVELTLEEILERAKTSEESKKFAISANHYLNILTKFPEKLSKDKLQEIINSAVFNILLLSPGFQKERLLNFLLRNENLDIVLFKNLLQKV